MPVELPPGPLPRVEQRNAQPQPGSGNSGPKPSRPGPDDGKVDTTGPGSGLLRGDGRPRRSAGLLRGGGLLPANGRPRPPLAGSHRHGGGLRHGAEAQHGSGLRRGSGRHRPGNGHRHDGGLRHGAEAQPG
ncbi:hypothetical protein ACWGJJ_06035, partial [Streptomyces sp. NPDC054787]